MDPVSSSALARRRGKSLSGVNLPPILFGSQPDRNSAQGASRTLSQGSFAFPSETPEALDSTVLETPLPSVVPVTISATHRARRASAAEKVLEQLRSRDMQKSGTGAIASPRTSWINFQHENISVVGTTATTTAPSNLSTTSTTIFTASAGTAPSVAPFPASGIQESPTKQSGGRESRRQSLIAPIAPPSSPVMSKITLTPSRPTRPSRSPSAAQAPQLATGPSQSAIPTGLIPLLDGEHHTDELCVKFQVGWPLLEQWLIGIGGGEGDGDYGRVAIIYR